MVTPPKAPPGMVRAPSGRFLMGSDLPDYPEEGPLREVSVAGFWMDHAGMPTAQGIPRHYAYERSKQHTDRRRLSLRSDLLAGALPDDRRKRCAP